MNTQQQQNRIDMKIEPKSDQINYDDFIAGTKTITITNVTGSSNKEQPVNIHYDGDNGKPFRPCKTMRRLIVHVWGDTAKEYVGKSMTLYGDGDVLWGGKKVGGIRISHMSHIDQEITVPLTKSRAQRVPFTIKPLKMTQIDQSFIDGVESAALVAANLGTDKLREHYDSLPPEETAIVRKKLNDYKAIAAKVNSASKAEPDQTSDFPGDDNYKPE